MYHPSGVVVFISLVLKALARPFRGSQKNIHNTGKNEQKY